MAWIVVFVFGLLVQLIVELVLVWRKEEKKRRAAALGRAHGDARQSGDGEAILHGDLGAILRRQTPGRLMPIPPSARRGTTHSARRGFR
jgi:hypothetical protein